MSVSSGQIVTAVRRVVVHLAVQGSAFAREHGMNLTDIRGLIALNDLRRADRVATPGVLAQELGLASASTTQLLDRLEARHLVRRIADPDDRRRVRLETTEAASASGIATFGPLLQAIADLSERRTESEKLVILAFLEDLAALDRTGVGSRVGPPARP